MGKWSGVNKTTNTRTPTPTKTATLTRTATPVPTATATLDPSWAAFSSEDIALAYPPNWTVDDRSRDDKCIPGMVNCILRITAPEDPDSKITLIGLDFSVFGKDLDVHEFDASLWALEPLAYSMQGLEDEIKLISKRDIQIGGQPAVKRVFREAYIENGRNAGTLYIVRVLVVSQRQIYPLI